VNVTTPKESTAYVPTPATVTVVAEQAGLRSAAVHNFTLDTVREAPGAALSFVSKFFDWGTFTNPVVVSAAAVGTAGFAVVGVYVVVAV
jgi:hypothetical protein